MNRRNFLSLAAALPAMMSSAGPEIAFTFDDPHPQPGANTGILAALSKHRIKSVLFVCGMRIDTDSGHELITEWDRAGHLIANHSYSHLNLNEEALATFEADVLKNEPLVTPYKHFTRLFRYPFFKEGDTAEKRDGMRAFLHQHGYRIGRATIDASDWAISARMEKRVARSPSADLRGYRDFYLQHIWDRAQYYQGLARQVWPHPVRHTLLLHHNPLNALYFDNLVDMFVARAWRPVDAEYAYRDPIYNQQPQSLPAGESLIWALAQQTGRFEGQLRYPGEDDVYENPKMDALRL